jgi:hypothetical protein
LASAVARFHRSGAVRVEVAREANAFRVIAAVAQSRAARRRQSRDEARRCQAIWRETSRRIGKRSGTSADNGGYQDKRPERG